jgi:putative spermidine/putrescine transport system permease protein
MSPTSSNSNFASIAAPTTLSAQPLKTAWFPVLFIPSGFILLSLLATCVVLVRISFYSWSSGHPMQPDWTLSAYRTLLTDPVVRKAFVTTLRISVIVTAVCLLIGYPVAVGIARAGRWRPFLIFLLITPMLMDVLFRAYGWIVMLGQRGVINGLMTGLGFWERPQQLLYTEFSVILELIHELSPFMVLPIASVVERINPALREAAMNLKAGPARTFFHITLPLSIPGIVAGTLLTFALSMSAFVAPLVLGSGNVVTMTVLMRQSMFTTLNWPLGAAQSVTLVVLVVGMLAVYRRQLVESDKAMPG